MPSDFVEQFISPYMGIICRICRAYTSTQEDFEDYYQEVCLQIWRSKDHFSEQSEWSTWIYRLTLNVCLTLMKKKKRIEREFGSDSLPAVAYERKSNEFSYEKLDLLYEAIKQLSEIDRAVILLYLEKTPYKEIADIIGTNPNNIGVRVSRIKERLRERLDRNE